MASNSKKLRFAMIHEILPEEIMVLIFKKLDYKSLICANKVCSRWRQIIHGFNIFSVGNFGKYIYNYNFEKVSQKLKYFL